MSPDEKQESNSSGEVERFTLATLAEEADKLEPGILSFHIQKEVNRFRFRIAGWLFWSCIILICFSWLQNLFVPDWLISNCVDTLRNSTDVIMPTCEQRFNRLVSVSNLIFEFAKTWIPPFLGIIIGYYFTSSESAPSVNKS